MPNTAKVIYAWDKKFLVFQKFKGFVNRKFIIKELNSSEGKDGPCFYLIMFLERGVYLLIVFI